MKDFSLQAGTYSMNEDMSLRSLFSEVLKHPVSKDLTITLLPGWNIWDMDAYLAKQGILKPGEFTSSAENVTDRLRKDYPFLGEATTLEGFLVPDTYRINANASADTIVQTLLKAFDTRVYKEVRFASDKELYQTLVFASIVEKEEKSKTNKPIVAGILKKRFSEGKEPIGADATVCYQYRLTMDDCTPAFIGEHIHEKTPYNTRNSLKLPPTPISNPSVDTVLATMNSQSSPYYYYLHDNDGMIHYGKTLEEHNRNKSVYLSR